MNSAEYDLNELYKGRIPNPYERIFVIMLTKYLIFNELPAVSPAIWQDAEIEARIKDDRIPSDSNEDTTKNGGRALAAYSVRYVADHLKKNEIIEVLNDAAVENDQELPFFFAFGKKFGANHIYDIFFAQRKKKITKFDQKTFAKLFEYPCWIEFSKNAKEGIHKAILSNQLTDEEVDYYLGVSERHEDYAELLPVIKHIVTTTNDAHLFWTTGDVLNLIWQCIPDDEKMQKWFRKEIYSIFYYRIGNNWPILNHSSVSYDDPDRQQIFTDSYGWLTSLPDLGSFNPALKGVKLQTPENKKLSLTKFLAELESSDNVVYFDDERIAELCDNFDEVIKTASEKPNLMKTLLKYYRQLSYDAHLLNSADGLKTFGAAIKDYAAKNFIPKAYRHCEDVINKSTAYAEREIADFHREQDNLKKYIMQQLSHNSEQ